MKRVWLASGLILAGCAAETPDPVAVRLVDAFGEATISGALGEGSEIPKTEWRFGPEGTLGAGGWKAGPGVAGLRVDGVMLRGRTTSETGLVHIERTGGLDSADTLHEIVIRMKASKGTNLGVAFVGEEELKFAPLLGRAAEVGWELTTPIIAGDEIQTYRLSPNTAFFTPSFAASSMRHVVVNPTDVAGADFEIESVRLVFRREHLASIPAGVSWQGLSDVFRETIVTHSPERAAWRLRLPARPWLDLAIGTPEMIPVKFTVTVQREPGGTPQSVLERTVTRPNQWDEERIDLAAFAGEEVTLSLATASEAPRAIGFWGAPTVRRSGAQVAAVSETAASRGRTPPQGIIVVLHDTLRRDHLSGYGYHREASPVLDGLAREGVIFKDAIAQGAWTKVSVPSMLTSTYSTSNGVSDFTDRVPASAVTLAEVLRDAGYATWQSSSVPFSGRLSNLHQGVEVLHERASIDLPKGQSSAKTARTIVDRLNAWIEDHHDVPFYALLHAMDPHDPYEPYAPYDSMWAAPDGRDRYKERVEKVLPFIERSFMKRRELATSEELAKAGVEAEPWVQHQVDWYDGSIRAADVELGRVLEKLRELGIEDRTLIVFLSDHGEQFLEHGRPFHEEHVYGELINVPLVFRWPGVVPAGGVVDETVQLLDVVPTILDLAGIPAVELHQGASLRPLITGERRGWTDRPAISEWKKRADQKKTDIVDAFGIIHDGWKLVHNTDRPGGQPEFELFEHRKDPLNLDDVAAEHPEIVARLQKQLETWHSWAQDAKLPSDAEASEGLDSGELERLRSLGYVQ